MRPWPWAWACLVGVSLGNTILLMTLAASASYIAVKPAVVRHAIPEANPTLYFSLSLWHDFPVQHPDRHRFLMPRWRNRVMADPRKPAPMVWHRPTPQDILTRDYLTPEPLAFYSFATDQSANELHQTSAFFTPSRCVAVNRGRYLEHI